MLSDKETKFVEAYLIDPNATQAAIKAGYAKSTAKYASYWLNEKAVRKPYGSGQTFKPHVKAELERRLAEISKARIADAQEVLEYLTSVVRKQSRASVVVVEGVGDGCSNARLLEKPPDEKEALDAAKQLAKYHRLLGNEIKLDIATPVVISGKSELTD